MYIYVRAALHMQNVGGWLYTYVYMYIYEYIYICICIYAKFVVWSAGTPRVKSPLALFALRALQFTSHPRYYLPHVAPFFATVSPTVCSESFVSGVLGPLALNPPLPCLLCEPCTSRHLHGIIFHRQYS